MKKIFTPKILMSITLIIFFITWFCVPTFNKWRADQLVDELCAQDGGIKVYETVTLPKEKFNQWGQFEVQQKNYSKNSNEFYYLLETKNIVGNNDSSEISRLTVYRSDYKIFRTNDQKPLGQYRGYTRTGGDPPAPRHPSSYSCPNNSKYNEFIASIFIQSKAF